MKNSERAAILLLGMGQEQAAEVLRHMDSQSIERLAVTMRAMSDVSDEQVNEALQGFLSNTDSSHTLGLGSSEYIRETLIGALGDDKARELLDKTLSGEQSGGLGSLNWHNPDTIIDFIRDEHPQVAAIVLTYLDSAQAALVVNALPESTRVEVIKRVATLGQISPLAIDMMNEVLEGHISDINDFDELPPGGARMAAAIMNFVNSDTEQKVIAELASIDKDLQHEVEEQLFTFETLADLDEASLQLLLMTVPNEVLQVALRACDDALIQLFFKNMSVRDATKIKDSAVFRGPVQLSKAIAAQKEVITVAQKMAKNGELVFSDRMLAMAR